LRRVIDLVVIIPKEEHAMSKTLLSVLCVIALVGIASCAGAGGVTKEMVGWWKFDGNGKNEIAKGAEAALAGGPKFEGSGKIGGCLTFDGVDDNAFIEGNYDLPVYTICVWYQVNADVLKRMDLVSAYAPGVMHGVLLELNLDGTFRYLHRFPLGQSGGVNINTEEAYKDGKWHHVAIVKAPETITIYVDGVPVQTAEETSKSPGDTFGVSLGCLDNERALDRLLVGKLDDLRIYNAALTPDALKAIMEFK
jgi:sialidase-1